MARRAPAAARSAAPRAFAYRPQLAALVTRPPAGRAWLHELKLDGYRIGLESTADGVRLHSRRGRDVTAEFPELARDAGALGGRDALLDGELVADVAPGASTFQALQRRGRAHTPLRYHAFDLLRLDGEDVRALPLVRRKALLGELLGDGRGGIVRVRHFDEEGAEVLRHACRLGAEGIVSKRRAAPYRDGARHPDWQKTKCVLRQELVVGGFTDPSAAASGVGSLLVGYREAGALRFAGKVSTGPGWGAAFGRELRARLAPLASVRCPFDPPPSDRWLARHAHWVRPALVCEVEFGE